MLMAAAVVLPVVSFADMPATVYVVPAGTDGNTPTAPYDTWATAANDIKVAAEQVATHGVVKVLEGAYPSSTGYITTRAYELQVFTDTSESTAGTVTLSDNWAWDSVEDEDPDHHSILITKGTVTTSGSNFFTDARTGDVGYLVHANHKVTFSGAETMLSGAGKDLYAGYWTDGVKLTFTDGATAAYRTTYIGQSYAGSYVTFTVEKGATVDLTGSFQMGASAGTDNTLVVSNATLKIGGSYNLGATGAETRTRIVLAGSNSLFRASSAAYFRGDTELHVDLSEMPVSGYASAPIFPTQVVFDETASLTFGGLDQIRARLRAAKVTSLNKVPLACGWAGGASVVIPSAVLAAANASLGAAGFSIAVEGSYLYLYYKETGIQTVYADAANASPADPFDTWANAATSINTAKGWLAKGGTMMIASGTYADTLFAPDYAATFRAVVSSENDAPGTVTLGSTVFAGFTGTNADPNRRLLTLAQGTFLVPSGSTVFLDSASGGQYEANASNRLVVTGANTVFSDSAHNMYVGYAAKNTQLIVEDGAKAYAGTVYSGRLTHGKNSTVVVRNGGLFSATSMSMGPEATGATLVVDDATASIPTLTTGNGATPTGERITLKGAAPYLYSNNLLRLNGNGTLEFDVGELKLGTVDDHQARVFTAEFELNSDATLKISGCDRLKARHEADKTAKARITYPLLYAWKTFNLSDEKLAAAAADLPEGWTLTKDKMYLYLTIHKQVGLSVIIR